jgi:hypothetical protein
MEVGVLVDSPNKLTAAPVLDNSESPQIPDTIGFFDDPPQCQVTSSVPERSNTSWSLRQ